MTVLVRMAAEEETACVRCGGIIRKTEPLYIGTDVSRVDPVRVYCTKYCALQDGPVFVELDDERRTTCH